MNKPVYSYIVPIFNDGYLARHFCREFATVFAQAFPETPLREVVELIFVNDGSTDSSINLLKDLLPERDFLRVIDLSVRLIMIAFDSSSCESPREGSDVGNERPSNGAGDCRFEILCQSATATEPCESTFDNPSAWQNFKALRRVGTFDDFYRPFPDTLQSLAQFISGIATIGKDMAEPGIARTDRSKDAQGAIAILNAGFVHDEPDHVALGVGDDVALAALDLLSCIKAPWATAFRGFHRLAVNHSGRRARLSASRLARRHDESVVQ